MLFDSTGICKWWSWKDEFRNNVRKLPFHAIYIFPFKHQKSSTQAKCGSSDGLLELPTSSSGSGPGSDVSSSVSSSLNPKLARVLEQLRRLKERVETPPKEPKKMLSHDFLSSEKFKRMKVAHENQKVIGVASHGQNESPKSDPANEFLLPSHVSWIWIILFMNLLGWIMVFLLFFVCRCFGVWNGVFLTRGI